MFYLYIYHQTHAQLSLPSQTQIWDINARRYSAGTTHPMYLDTAAHVPQFLKQVLNLSRYHLIQNWMHLFLLYHFLIDWHFKQILHEKIFFSRKWNFWLFAYRKMCLICIQYESSFIKIREIDYSRCMVLKWEKNELNREVNKTHTYTTYTYWHRMRKSDRKRDIHTKRKERESESERLCKRER